MKKSVLLLVTIIMSFSVFSQTVVDIIVGSDDHETLETAVIAAGLVDDLSGPGPFTVFAPTDAAFAALPEGVLDDLLADPEGALANVLLYHVASGDVMSGDLMDGMMVPTLQGQDLMVTINMDGVFINDAQVTMADLGADNGVVHVIDVVLVPQPEIPATVVEIIVNSDAHETLETAVIAAGLDDDLSGDGPFTVFAPTDDAFAALPMGVLDDLLADPEGALANVLLYHVASGDVMSGDLMDGMMVPTLQGQEVMVTINMDGVFINGAQVILTDLEAENGVVHVIDAVLVPQPEIPATVVEIIVDSDVHEILETAVLAAGLDDDLSGDGPFTVFAPTDDAFDALPMGVLDDLLADPEGALASVLLYHVASGDVMSGDLMDGMMVPTLQGQEVMVTINMDGVFINDAQVILADLEAENGVVHVIDAVLVPESIPATVVDIIVDSDAHETLEVAVIAAGLDDDLSGDGPFTVFAPTDDAFAALPAGLLDELLADPEGALANVLLYHVASGDVMSGDLMDGMMIPTLQGQEVMVTINMDGVFINDAQVILADLEAENGVVHVIDAVLVPEAIPATVVDIIVDSDVHETLEVAVIAAGLDDDLSGDGPFTVFAPTDDAFAALPAGLLEDLLADPEGALANVLLYHVASGDVMSGDLMDGMMIPTLQGQDVMVMINMDGIFINDAQVILADLVAENGVVHVIDAVLVPESIPATVVDIIVDSDVHETLEVAVIAAGLDDDLSGDGPFTVFAPTDDAFAALPAGLLDELLADPEGALANVLLYHVAEGNVMSGDLMDGMMVPTLQGQSVEVTINMDGIFINDAQVILADLVAENGVVHVIDVVLVPVTTGVEDEIEVIQSLYPNPTLDYINVNLDPSLDNAQMDIVDVRGNVVITDRIQSKNVIDVQNLAPGMYVLRVVLEERVVTKSFMVD